MKAYGLALSDTYSLLTLNSMGSRTLHWTVVREIEQGRNALVRHGLATLDGNVLTITDKGRDWCKPSDSDLPF